jgi:hypothetical protein
VRCQILILEINRKELRTLININLKESEDKHEINYNTKLTELSRKERQYMQEIINAENKRLDELHMTVLDELKITEKDIEKLNLIREVFNIIKKYS